MDSAVVDSTSRIFGIGKKTAFKKLVKGQPIIKKCANCFILPNQTGHIIKDLGNKAMTVMFGNGGSSNLETLRYSTLVKKLQQPSPLFTLDVCYLLVHHPLSNSTASEFTTNLWSGWVLMMVSML